MGESDNFVYGETDQTAEFQQKFPLYRCVGFEDSNGFCLTDCDAILYHISSTCFCGGDKKETQGLIRQLVSLASYELHTLMTTLCYPGAGVIRPDKTESQQASQRVEAILGYLDGLLKDSKYLASAEVSLADVSIFCEVLPLMENFITKSNHPSYPNFLRWFEECSKLEHFKSVVGCVSFCNNPAPFNKELYDKFNAIKISECKPSKSSKKTPQGSKPAQIIGSQKPPAKPELVKKKGPFDDLPPTKFVMDEWKRMYSNNDTLKVAMPWLWSNLDFDGFSFWFGKYKYNNELKEDYLIENLIEGTFKRISALTKYAFGCVHVYGTEGVGNWELTSLWLLRGQKLAFEINEDFNDDAVHYTWKKMDHNVPADKEFVEKYFAFVPCESKFPLVQKHVFK